MLNQKAHTIQIFLPDGDPTSIKIAEIKNRIVIAVLFPRLKLAEVASRKEVSKDGIYFLFGDDEIRPIAYIGETDNCLARIKEHDSRKKFWNYAIIISSVSNSFTKSDVKYLEYLCIKTAKQISRYKLDNGNTPSEPNISESQEVDLQNNFETVKMLLSTLGYPIFEEFKREALKKEILYCKGKGAHAEGDMLNDGFVVFKGSTANKSETKTIGPSSSNLRKRLIDDKILIPKGNVYQFTDTYIFKTPSAAADTVLGRSANGWTAWKNKQGKTIDQIYRSNTEG